MTSGAVWRTRRRHVVYGSVLAVADVRGPSCPISVVHLGLLDDLGRERLELRGRLPGRSIAASLISITASSAARWLTSGQASTVTRPADRMVAASYVSRAVSEGTVAW